MQNNNYNHSSHIIYTVKRRVSSHSRESKVSMGLQTLCARFTQAEFFALLALLGLQLAFGGVFLSNCASHGFSRAPGHTIAQVKKVLLWPFTSPKKPEGKPQAKPEANPGKTIGIYVKEQNKLLDE